MPPEREREREREQGRILVDSWFFRRVHPLAIRLLGNYGRMTQPLLILTMIVNSSLLQWQPVFPLGFKGRVFVWYLAYTSFFSRHLLAILNLAWLYRLFGAIRNE